MADNKASHVVSSRMVDVNYLGDVFATYWTAVTSTDE